MIIKLTNINHLNQTKPIEGDELMEIPGFVRYLFVVFHLFSRVLILNLIILFLWWYSMLTARPVNHVTL